MGPEAQLAHAVILPLPLSLGLKVCQALRHGFGLTWQIHIQGPPPGLLALAALVARVAPS